MKRRWVWIVVGANLVVLLALAFIYPQFMVAPGPLAKVHAELATDCFACHAPLRGTTSEKCVACHAVPDIGLRTTRGVPIAKATVKASFHQELSGQNCMACHSEHADPRFTHRDLKQFSHALLRPATLQRCESCHSAPKDNMHRDNATACASCHETKAWTPATFEHSKFFVLDTDHNASCSTCHTTADRSQYTCYGCHEHTKANILEEHQEEGIRDFNNCVECHRSADGEPERRGDQRKRD